MKFHAPSRLDPTIAKYPLLDLCNLLKSAEPWLREPTLRIASCFLKWQMHGSWLSDNFVVTLPKPALVPP